MDLLRMTYALCITFWCCILIVYPVGWAATLHVPQDQPTIQKAIDAAQEGDTVLISPGRYEEDISLRSGITLQGSGDATELSQTLKLVSVERVVVSTLQVKGTGQDSHFGIFCLDADTQIHDVTVRAFHHGISAESSHLTLRTSRIEGSFNVGILLAQHTEATIEGNTIVDNAAGIIIGNTQRPITLQGNRIESNHIGLECHDAAPRLRDNLIAGNFVGMRMDNATPDLGTEADAGRNAFIDNKQWAIQYADRKPLFALMNWWGQATGPLVGQVVGQVHTKPWLRADPRDTLVVERSPTHFTTWGRVKKNPFGEN